MSPLTGLAIIPGLVAALIAFMATIPTIYLAKKLGIITDPKIEKHPKVIHTYPVPRGGGAAIFLAVLIASLIFIPHDQQLTGILLGAVVVTLVGLLDDKFNLNPYLRIALGIVAAAIPVAAGIGIAYLSNPFGQTIDLSQPQFPIFFLGQTRTIWILSDLVAIFWIVFLMNMLNMGAKGVDGQLPGVAGISAIIIAILSLKFSADIAQWPVITLAGITAGAFLGFLPWSFYPQKIMPSFGGATLAGYLLAVLAILSQGKVGIVIVALGVPLIDTGYTILRRILSGKSPVWGDTGHLHHRLLAIGWSKRKVAFFYWGVTALLGIIALNLNTLHKFYTMVGVAAVLGVVILWLTYRRSNS